MVAYGPSKPLVPVQIRLAAPQIFERIVMISSLYSEIKEMIFDYCAHDCDMRDYCASHDCPITVENYQDYIFPDSEQDLYDN